MGRMSEGAGQMRPTAQQKRRHAGGRRAKPTRERAHGPDAGPGPSAEAISAWARLIAY
jgi:hypothetical protein